MYYSYIGEIAMFQIEQLMIATGFLTVLVGVMYAAVVYVTIERVPMLASVVALSLAAVLVGTGARLGELLLSVTVTEMKLLTVVAVVGAVAGIAAVVTVFEPTPN